MAGFLEEDEERDREGSGKTVAEDDMAERNDGERRDSTEGRRLGVGGGSYPECCTPRSQIGSVDLLGIESLSSKKRIARSRCPLPCFAAVSKAELLVLGNACEVKLDCESIDGRDRSVDELVKVCDSHPDSRVGRSDIRVDDVEAYMDEEGCMSEMVLRGRSERFRERIISTGSIITGVSSNESSCSLSGSGCGLLGLSSLRLLLAFPPPNLPLFRELYCESGGLLTDVQLDELELAMDVVLAAAIGSVIDFDLSRLCFARNLDNFEPCGDEEEDEDGVLRDCRPVIDMS